MQSIAQAAAQMLTGGLLPFWRGLRDEEYGGYYGYMDFDLHVDLPIFKQRVYESVSTSFVYLVAEAIEAYRHAGRISAVSIFSKTVATYCVSLIFDSAGCHESLELMTAGSTPHGGAYKQIVVGARGSAQPHRKAEIVADNQPDIPSAVSHYRRRCMAAGIYFVLTREGEKVSLIVEGGVATRLYEESTVEVSAFTISGEETSGKRYAEKLRPTPECVDRVAIIGLGHRSKSFAVKHISGGEQLREDNQIGIRLYHTKTRCHGNDIFVDRSRDNIVGESADFQKI